MGNDNFIELCKRTVAAHLNDKYFGTGLAPVKASDVYVVWMCKTLQNNKALLSTDVVSGIYYELTYNGDKDELYVDMYKKAENVCIGGIKPTC